MLDVEILLISGSFLLIACVLMSKLTGRVGIPTLLVFIGVGMLAGSEGIGGILFDDHSLAQTIGIISLVLILFSGGLDTEWKRIKPYIPHGLSLATFGVLITCGLVGVFGKYALNFSWLEALLLGAIVSSTDAAAVFTVLRARGLSFTTGLREVLELESGSNDPMAVFLTLLFIQLLGAKDLSYPALFASFFLQMGIGFIVGAGVGRWLRVLLNKVRLEFEGLYPVLTISFALLTYAITQRLGGNGFLAVYIAALILGRSTFIHKKSLILFHDSIAWLMQILMFLALGLLVYPSDLVNVTSDGVILAIFMLLIARPVAVFVTMAPTSFNWREKMMISWMGLRGAVPIVLCTYALSAEASKSGLIFNIVFFVVLVSTLVQGFTLKPLASLLKVAVEVKKKIRFPFEYVSGSEMQDELKEIEIPRDSIVVGKAIAELNLPQKLLIVLLRRGEDVFAPRGSTVFQPLDSLLILAETVEYDFLINLVTQISQEESIALKATEPVHGEVEL
ncbi:MAG: potassium/proton antiporter [Bdellovibrionales bacterium CG12_big_fil_rev_8_21_14_0_65_38_15]|nr:MAG: potassium/proton antiporter [Bdellovibrionales bacterium CG22_combo_CG10-13_8_21_14_all_38_13]PIQ54786.1 MAG: potassium/proton antiporter [Bdellovibrionales bacterium CG12_big_fil_rev_8_21_14_0_65_38_15]PIR31447.1 MAG: potassium/proton antiporter [Bdellovibrionales bacterium CG11_big_fil_rev_8_21_14_0_20_38_13]